MGDVILGLNVAIFLTAAFFLGVEESLYSILTYVSASKTLDFLLHGIEEYTAITIISEKSGAIRQAITGTLGRGVTVYRGRGGLTGADQEILMCVVTRLEIGKVMDIAQGDRPNFGLRHRPPHCRRQGGIHQEDRPPLTAPADRERS